MILSPLRYPGGKSKLAPHFKNIIKYNNLVDGRYIEPFAGGAGVGLSLLVDEYVRNIVINDIDKSIFSFWNSILNKTDEFCQLIENTPITVEEWIKQKEIQTKKHNNVNELELGFSTFFLNRTNRSGIMYAGPIGGREQSGKWKIDARFNKNNLIERIKRIAMYKNRIKITNLDTVVLIKKMKKELTNKDLIYFDPPYYNKGKELYLNYYNHKDHLELSKKILELEDYNWVVTYDNCDIIKELYLNQNLITYDINYSIGKKTKGAELMILGNKVMIPPNFFPTAKKQLI